MTRLARRLFIIGVIAILATLVYKYLPDYLGIMKPAPPGIHGLYSLRSYGRIYKTRYSKDSLLGRLANDGLTIKSGRLHDYDPPWDSLRYLIDNVVCDTQKVEPYIEFRKEKERDSTTFRILWINATPNESYDTTLYQNLTKKYYDCFETILKRNGVKH
ncbi:MAG: hypothetical protein EOP48_09795 [Sphingobacteriales bacterium]|nr:MAG: hypothetical protein EOP48_09795 [Sphingobacteriales bacterium]